MPDAGESTTDVVMAIQDPYMDQIINGTKNYEFRKYCLKPDVKRIWFYRNAPHSALTHVCEILPAHTRNPGDTALEGDAALEEDGIGNAEFNSRHKDWDGYDFAYKILSVYELRKPIPLTEMITACGFQAAPRGLLYLPRATEERVLWYRQKLVLKNEGVASHTLAESVPARTDGETIPRESNAYPMDPGNEEFG